MAFGQRRLQTVGTASATACVGASQRRDAPTDLGTVPPTAVLVGQQDRRTVPCCASGKTGCLELHQRHERVHFGFVGNESCQDPAEPQRLVAQLGSDPPIAGRRRVTLVEHQVDHTEHGGKPARIVLAGRHLERHPSCAERFLRAHDALLNGRRGHEECLRDLFGGETTDDSQRQSDLSLPRQHRVGGDEDQSQHVVVDVVGVPTEVGIRPGVQVAGHLHILRVETFLPTPAIDCPSLGHGGEPGARISRDTRLRPLRQRLDQRLLRQVLGDTDITHHPCQGGDDLGCLHTPHRVNGAVDGFRRTHLRSDQLVR